MINNFNIRVYGVCIREGKLLTLNESFMGKEVVKLPGGGLEFGEGTIACLKREFKEELGVEITVKDSFYIQETFVPSLVKDNRQIVMLYFLVQINNPNKLVILDSSIKSYNWVSISEHCPLTLPVDKCMYEKLKVYCTP
jgi:8-oxo-dGTP diphosphatase